MIKWQESYSTGITKLDDQHKSLFEYCNDLEEWLNTGGLSKETLAYTLSFMDRYIKGHFGQEETCMFKYACPIAGKNKIAHDKFIEAFKIFQNKINGDKDSDAPLIEFHHFLKTWLTDHICKIDTQLKSCVH